jgi:pyrimidine operon attenuation protein/uracil phosphoribosyltransferase
MQLDADKLIELLAEQIRPTLADNTVVVGIHTGGAWVAHRLATMLNCHPVGFIAVTLHRDDFAMRGLHPQTKASELPFDIDSADVLLVDDVLQSGRTVRAALNELYDYGRPASVRLAVLIDRGGRELPIEATFTAMKMPLGNDQKLELTEDHQTLRFNIKPR